MSVIFVELFKLKHQCTRTTARWRPSFSCRCSSRSDVNRGEEGGVGAPRMTTYRG